MNKWLKRHMDKQQSHCQFALNLNGRIIPVKLYEDHFGGLMLVATELYFWNFCNQMRVTPQKFDCILETFIDGKLMDSQTLEVVGKNSYIDPNSDYATITIESVGGAVVTPYYSIPQH